MTKESVKDISSVIMSSDVPRNINKMDVPEFAYLPPPKEIVFGKYEEGLREKLVRKTKENPAVPFGKVTCYITIYILH